MKSKDLFAHIEAVKYALSPQELDELVGEAVKAQMQEHRPAKLRLKLAPKGK